MGKILEQRWLNKDVDVMNIFQDDALEREVLSRARETL